MKEIKPGGPSSIWIETTAETNYPKLSGGKTVDVAVIGGGIIGLTAAALALDEGLSVAVLESRRIARAVTGYTTAKVTALHGLKYQRLVEELGEPRARQYGAANQAAVEMIAGFVRDKSIDCDFARTKAYTYTEEEAELSSIRNEAETAAKLGLPSSFAETAPLPFPIKGAVVFKNQAQFHPRKYLLALARDIVERGGSIFEETPVDDITGEDPHTVNAVGGSVKARHVVVATHFPFHDKGFFYARMVPSRAYLLALRLSGPVPEGMYYFSRGEQMHSLRDHRSAEGDFLIVGGGRHDSGHVSDTIGFYEKTYDYAARRFPVESIEYYWSTEDYWAFDHVPYIGRSPDSDTIYVATGMAGWGMSNGTAGAMLITDLIAGRDNPWRDLFSPRRMDTAEIKGTVRQNLQTAARFAKERVTGPEPGRPEDLSPGEGRIMDFNGEKTAVCRTVDGRVHALDPFCTHMGCVVNWNNAEQTWDCPCHGSVFEADGRVAHGPALRPLEPEH